MFKIFKCLFKKTALSLPKPVRRDADDIAKIYARLFSTEDGQAVLAHLNSQTFYRSLPADTPDTQLRYYEGQRALLLTMVRFIERGRT